MKTTLFNFSKNSILAFDKEASEWPDDPSAHRQAVEADRADLVRPGIYDCTAGNQMYSDLVESLGLAGKTDEQMFSEYVEANRRFYLKTTRAGRAQSGSGDLFELEYDRQLKIINWYFPPQIDKTEVIFHHVWLQEPPEQIAYERCVDASKVKRLSKDFTKLWRIADLRNPRRPSRRKLKDHHLEFIEEFIKRNKFKHWTAGTLKYSIEKNFEGLHQVSEPTIIRALKENFNLSFKKISKRKVDNDRKSSLKKFWSQH